MRLPRPAALLRTVLAVGVALALAGPGSALADVQDDILQQTAEIRGLTLKAPVPFAFVEPATLRSELLTSFENAEAVRELEISRKLLVVLGLLSPDADLHGTLVDLYAENVAGLYNRVDKKMYVVGQPVFGPSAKTTLAHEFTHALQDQHFDLGVVHQAGETDGDHSLAVSALIEGDATLTMVLYARTYLTPSELIELQIAESGESSIERMPLVVRDEVLFPYNEGTLFAFELWQRGGFEALNAAFRDPPRSTEQIIHPAKYLAREQPIAVELPDLAAALGPGWSLLRSDVLGELDYRILLQQFVGEAAAQRGAAGWGGDRFVLLESATGDLALVLSTVWDSDSETTEFVDHYRELVRSRYGRRAVATQETPSRLVWNTPNGPLLLQRSGTRVGIVMAPNERVLNTLAAALDPSAPPPAQPGTPQAPPAQVPR